MNQGHARYRLAIVLLSAVLVFWFGMMATHEFGHILHAVLSGGEIERVVLHPLAFSRTDVHPNPHPLWVACGGVIWGCLIPLAAWGLVLALRWRRGWMVGLFAGFCLIANGAYLAAALVLPVGDAQDLIRLGVPRWVLVVIGSALFAGGLFVWHLADPRRANRVLRTSPAAAPPASARSGP